jgi:hypothetical protein
MTDRPTRAQRMDLAYATLRSGDDQAIMEALDRIELHGDARAIRPLLEALSNNPSFVVEQRINSLLHQVKAADAVPTLIELLAEPDLKGVRRTTVSIFWNAGLDARDHLPVFVDLAIAGSADECFECVTVIENQEIWPEKAARIGHKRLLASAADCADPYKRAMLEGAAQSLHERLNQPDEGQASGS